MTDVYRALEEYDVPWPSENGSAAPGEVVWDGLSADQLDDPKPAAWPEPEDRGHARLTELGGVELVEDLVRPGRITVWAAEEGAGKTTSVDGELAIRIATAGGAFAGTWNVIATGPVLLLSEQHPDDDFANEERVLAALQLDRAALDGRYFRLGLMTAAGEKPALTVAEWRTYIVEWMRERNAVLLIVDTATGATQVDPWGREIQGVYRDLRLMIESYPRLSIILIIHLKKPTGRGARRISDVMGEWGRWCDVVVLQEADGTARTKITTYKRVRHQRHIVATRSEGLLVEPVDLDEAASTKVPVEKVLAVIRDQPGIGYAELAKALDVSKPTATKYVKALGDMVDSAKTGAKGAFRLFLSSGEPPTTENHEGFGGAFAVEPHE